MEITKSSDRKRVLFGVLQDLGFIGKNTVGVVTIEVNLNQGVTSVFNNERIKVL